MNFYQELTLLPNADIGPSFLWEKIFGKIHIGLTKMKTKEGSIPIGISFPQYSKGKCGIGSKIRFFSTDRETLETCDIPGLISMFSDYVHVTSIRPVPSSVAGYAIYCRVQTKTNPRRLARRKAKRSGIAFEEALDCYKGFEEKFINTPYLKLKSWSNGQPFRLFIDKKESDLTKTANFNCYGLSNDSSVPEF